MRLQSAWTLNTLCYMVLAGATAAAGLAQTPTASASSESYIIKLQAPQVDTADAAAIRKHNVIPAAVYWDNLYNIGKVALLGSAQDGNTKCRVVIVEGVNEDQAKAIASADPNVKAGVVTAEVIPFHVELAKNSQGQVLPGRR